MPNATGISARDLLAELVAIPSLSGQEGRAVSWLVEQMAAHGFDAHVDPAGNAVGSLGDGAQEIMLLGHIDTVPGDIPVRVENDVLYGRGAVDAKGPLATFVAAALLADIPAGVKVTVVGAVGEETFGSPGATWLRDHHPAPAAVIIGEPSGWDAIVLGYKGSTSLRARYECPLSHSAGPEVTAAETIFGFWSVVLDWLRQINGDTEPGFSSLDGVLRDLDSGSDGLTEWASLAATFRMPPEVASTQVHAEVEAIARDFGVEVAWTFNAEAYRCDRRSALIAPFFAAIRSQGAKPRTKVKTGTSDMNVVGPAWGCPMLAYGPGDSSYDHTPDEQIELAEVDRAVAVLAEALGRFGARLRE
ncbi:MAG TPA: [LysW]-lysine hydrolase [Thermomicrobiales bacterium]|nr:[LysW]-lysine hydrolase [Thermomicrobiales bacterium]